MKIGFDISDLATNRADGTTRYTRALAERLPRLAVNENWHFFSPGAITIPAAANVTTHISPWPKYWTQARLPFDLLRVKPDILFMPIQQLPILRPAKMRTVAVIHDLAVHKFPEQFTYKDWLLLHAFSAQAAQQAHAIIAVSQATADDIAYYYGRTKNVHVVPHGVDHVFFHPATPDEQTTTWQQVTQAHPALRQPFLLFVGQIQPRKNIVRLVEAFEELAKEQPELQLAIAGGHGWLQQPILQKISQSNYKDRILLLGRVNDTILRALYLHAEAFVLPSLYEGFGLPVLEAMASGCPVVTSNISSLPEVAGDAAILINPADTESLTDGLRQAQQQKDRLRAAGIKQAQKFTWDRCAQETLKVLLATQEK